MEIREDTLLPTDPAAGHAVDVGWPAATGSRPHGVTWHWTATEDLAECRRLIGGPEPERKGQASAHYGVGRTWHEGIDRYVRLEDRSWHAGKQQRLRWDGRAYTGAADKGARTCIGIETVHIGYARRGYPSEEDWIRVATPNGKWILRVPPWPEEQIEMMIEVGKEIVAAFPHIRPEHHHGHSDLCPTYKQDVLGFPFARVLSGIYGREVPDVWTPYLTVKGRQRALVGVGVLRGEEDEVRRGVWGEASDAALRRFQREWGLVEDGLWTGFVGRELP